MKRFYIVLIILVVLLSGLNYINAQEVKKDDELKAELSGFVKTDIFFDSRQTVNLREGHFLLYPANESFDVNQKDVNANSSLNMISIQSRLTGTFSGLTAFDAKTTAVVEGEFFGTSNSDVNGFRLRHAFIKLNWEKAELLIGQYWNPNFVAESFPGVVSFNTGSPFQPFARNPQVRFSYLTGDLKFIATAFSQRDFTSPGPDGSSNTYLRNALLPNVNLQVQYKSNEFFAGVGGDYKKLVPRLKTTKNYSTTTSLSTYAATAFFAYKDNSFAFRTQGTYGYNLADLLMLGGYAVTSLDTTNGYEEYSGLKSFSLWTDISYGQSLQFGLFGGYSKNLGCDEVIKGTIYSSNQNIDNLLRIAPRVIFNSGKVRFAFELETTVAAYGTLDSYAKVSNTKSLTNVRGLFAAYYFLK